MREHRRRGLLAVLLLTLVPAAVAADAASAADRYAYANGCYAMRTDSGDRFLERSGDGWRATATSLRAADGFRMHASALGRYLLLARDGSFLATDGGRVWSVAAPDASGDWRVDGGTNGAFRLTVHGSDRRLGVGERGGLTAGGDAAAFKFVPTTRCAEMPEAEVNVTGTPYQGPTPFGEVKGLIETHLHAMAFEFLGGSVHCGRPWHPLGITAALVDCPDHAAGGQAAVLENLQADGNPVSGHNTDGWPSFAGWPHYRTYTHEQTYYKWLERAWRGGLRLWVNLLVDNEVLCEVYPLKRNPCNEMHNVRLQRQRIDELIEYIDAQNGGPGKGWMRIVRDPFEARRVINEGKLALVLGIETSKLFDCGEVNYVPQCDRAQIDRQLDEVHAMGVRQMELVNKLDNGLSGVAGDAGEVGIVTNLGNKQDTGHFWAMETCQNPTAEHDHDKEQITTPPGGERDELVGAIFGAYLPRGSTPSYPPAPHCNTYGLTDLGAHLVRQMMKKQMIFDPDHMSVVARDQALALIEAADYGGVMSSHSWSTPDSYRRIMRLGGVVTPAEKTVPRFIEQWNALKPYRNPRYLYGTGWSTDMNGFAAQGPPRADAEQNPLPYPFTSIDGSTVLDRNKTGTRTWDLNKDGTAHFGLYPDVMADVSRIGGPEITQDVLNGAEAYVQMWERASGVPGPQCRAAQRRFIASGLGEIRLGMEPEQLLRSAGQPQKRPGRRWTWCAGGTRGGEVTVLLTPEGRVQLVASTAPYHRYAAVGRDSSAKKLRRTTRRLGKGLRVRRARGSANRVVYGVRRGLVTFTAVVSRDSASSRARLRETLKLAGLR